ncbi:V-type ATP synthase subunit I [Deinococcus irradiatisoli]|uniref:V-type ATP synthase subunit I n=1 Tax=Deinococcus irradiatisoli TaxID=2202254 RepID=A0A2Z3JBB4_9DEIO|nr:V-type ATPase 116kDa subunit family protein [Deinococcus irradiatisoli]AWN22447.1 V-type ATP synthase subunit I [Deinococcus irradiatisoli]
MINPMQQVVIATRKRESRAVIEALQDAGALHLVPVQGAGVLSAGPLSGEDAEFRRESERLLARTETTLTELGAVRRAAAPLPAEEQWPELLEEVARPAAELAKRRQALDGDLDVWRTYGPAVKALSDLSGGLDRSRRVSLVPFIYQKPEELAALQAALQASLEGRFELATRPLSGSDFVGAVATLTIDRDAARAALGKARLGELRLPGRFDGQPISEVARELGRIEREGVAQRDALERERVSLADRFGPTLFAIRDALSDQVAIHDVQGMSARGKYSLVMQGFVPDDRVAGLKTALDRFGNAVSYELHPVDSHHTAHVPVELKNSSYSKNFELILGMLPLPRYGNFDPTGIISFFFPLFFGFIIADIGYGLLFFILGTWFATKARRGEGFNLAAMNSYLSPGVMGKLGVIIRTMSTWAIFWGFLTGEFFGNLAEHLHLFYFNHAWMQSLWGITVPGEQESGLLPIVFPRLQPWFTNTALISTLLVGILMVIWGWLIRVQLASRHGDKNHLWEAIGMIGGLVGLVSLGFLSQGGNQLVNGSIYTDFSSPLLIVMYLGFAVFLVGMVMSKVFLMIIEILSQGGNIISFARLFAVGVAGAILANLATDLGWGMYERIGILGILIGIVLALLVHAFALAITIIGHVLQPIRLHFVEFLTPTGYHNESGVAYNPLRRLSPAASTAASKK